MKTLTAERIRNIKDQLSLVKAALDDIEDYLYEGANREAMQRALGNVSAAERFTVMLRGKIEKEI